MVTLATLGWTADREAEFAPYRVAGFEPGRVCLTAFQTEGFIVYSSSEFGPNTCRVFAPVVQR